MRARVDAALTLDAREVPPKVVERLCRMLSFPNPAFLDRLRLGLNPGAELETVCFAEQRAGELRLPRGAIHVLRRAAAQDGLIVACEDARVLPEATLDVPALGPRDYQSAAVEKLATRSAVRSRRSRSIDTSSAPGPSWMCLATVLPSMDSSRARRLNPRSLRREAAPSVRVGASEKKALPSIRSSRGWRKKDRHGGGGCHKCRTLSAT